MPLNKAFQLKKSISAAKPRSYPTPVPGAPSIRSFIADGWESTNLDRPHDAPRPIRAA